MDKNILEAAEWVWKCPVTENALVVLREIKSPHLRPGIDPPYLVCADLDSGRQCSFFLDELTEKVRRTEEEDYGFSWTSDADSEIIEHVMNAASLTILCCETPNPSW